ncbi:MAG: radical SAM protein [Euryarchaeota archaeon]|nr:radical SAM protein [Euryarchaeota archaeon]
MISQYVFGPVPSRRFGRSLGVNPLPRKTCNYSCIYCQLGRTQRLQRERKVFFPTDLVVEDVRKVVEDEGDGIDYITFMGDGEPTLAANLGEMAEGVRTFWKGKMALITNGSLFHDEDVRRAAMFFDVVSPTISAGDERTFRQMHRPLRSLTFDKVMEGLEKLRKEYSGEIWAELMLVEGVNDSLASLLNIRKVLRDVSPDRLYVGVPTRPPAESWALPPSRSSLRQVFDVFPEAIDMTEPEEGPFLRNEEEREAELIEIAKNHPLREDQAFELLSLSLGLEGARDSILRMVQEGRLVSVDYGGTTFYRVPIERKEGNEENGAID